MHGEIYTDLSLLQCRFTHTLITIIGIHLPHRETKHIECINVSARRGWGRRDEISILRASIELGNVSQNGICSWKDKPHEQ